MNPYPRKIDISAGVADELMVTSSHIYVCVVPNT